MQLVFLLLSSAVWSSTQACSGIAKVEVIALLPSTAYRDDTLPTICDRIRNDHTCEHHSVIIFECHDKYSANIYDDFVFNANLTVVTQQAPSQYNMDVIQWQTNHNLMESLGKISWAQSIVSYPGTSHRCDGRMKSGNAIRMRFRMVGEYSENPCSMLYSRAVAGFVTELCQYVRVFGNSVITKHKLAEYDIIGKMSEKLTQISFDYAALRFLSEINARYKRSYFNGYWTVC
ncbi:unnamed protein product [Dicrocoelium dendriticum]|nr:unnamed protein product [Dicrocoelium dendriticum]